MTLPQYSSAFALHSYIIVSIALTIQYKRETHLELCFQEFCSAAQNLDFALGLFTLLLTM